MPTNNLATGATRPLIAPRWDDISFGTVASPADPTVDGNLYYQATGTAGSRVFTIEWRKSPGAVGPVASFLVQLTKGSNVVAFDHSQGAGSAYSPTRSVSIGLAGPLSGDFLSLSDLLLAAATPAANLEVAPNPARDLVRVQGHNATLPVQLFDGQERLVRPLAPATEAVLDLRRRAAGLYVARTGTQTRRLAVE